MALSERTKNLLSLLLRIGLSSLLLIYLFSKIDTAKMIATLKNADFRYFYYALAIYVVINVVLFLRWIVFIRALGLDVSLKSIMNCYFLGIFFNLVLPTSTGGDIVKTIGLFKDTSQKAKVVASVVADRLSGFVTIVLIASITFALGHRLINDNSLLISILILGCASTAMVVILFNEGLFSFFCKVFNKIPKIKEGFMRLHYAIVLLKDKHARLFFAIALSLFSQLILAFAFYLVAKSLHQDIGIIYFIIFVPLICVISSLPSIGGLGVRDAGAVYLFSKVGVEPAVTLSITLINFFFMVAISVTGGIIYVVTSSSQRKKVVGVGTAAINPREI